METFCRALEDRSGLAYGPDKDYLFESRLRGLFPQNQLPDYQELTRLLVNDVPMSARIVEALVTSETFFFRDQGTFQALPELVKRSHLQPQEPLVIWSVGCATGQELYSILMGLEEVSPELRANTRVYGLDLSLAALDRARTGVYTEFEVARGLMPEHRARYLEAIEGRWRIKDPLRSQPSWLQANVLGEFPSLPRPHLIFCRNILIYFSEANKARVLTYLTERLFTGGYLVLGGSENALAYPGLEPAGTFCPTAYQRRK
jgi:chemotaxis protein methyltransferase CheR